MKRLIAREWLVYVTLAALCYVGALFMWPDQRVSFDDDRISLGVVAGLGVYALIGLVRFTAWAVKTVAAR